MDEDLIYEGEWLRWQAIPLGTGRLPAKEAVGRFSTRESLDLRVAAHVADTSFRTGRSPGGRLERVEGSRVGLYELKLTPPGRRGPHTRFLFVIEQRVAWVAVVLTKTRAKLARGDIDRADKIVQEWRARRSS